MCREFGLSFITCSLRLQKFSGWRDTFEKISKPIYVVCYRRKFIKANSINKKLLPR